MILIVNVTITTLLYKCHIIYQNITHLHRKQYKLYIDVCQLYIHMYVYHRREERVALATAERKHMKLIMSGHVYIIERSRVPYVHTPLLVRCGHMEQISGLYTHHHACPAQSWVIATHTAGILHLMYTHALSQAEVFL